MDTLTTEEYLSLSPLDRAHYKANCEFTDYAVKDGKLYIVSYPEPRLTWERLNKVLLGLKYHSQDEVPKGEIAVYGGADIGDNWNIYGMPYIRYGFQYVLYLDVQGCTERYGYNKEGQHAERPVLEEWLRSQGFTDEEIKGGVFWNWHGWSAKFVCRFIDCPPDCLPKKFLKWMKKHPEWNHKVFRQEEANLTGKEGQA